MKKTLIAILLLPLFCMSAKAQKEVRLGIIGLDTSHSPAFVKLLNDKESTEPAIQKYEIVAAYPYGSKVIKSSYERIPKYIEEVKPYGVKITSSIQELLDMVDGAFLETNDGHVHLEQAVEVFKSGKMVFIDKPLGATLGEALAICEMADRYGVKFFSASSLRFPPQTQKLAAGEYGRVIGADCFSPHQPEATHPDFSFYGIHGVETLITVMGCGCKSVSASHSEMGDVVTGVWDDGRIGTFRAIVKGPYIYGGTAFLEKGKSQPVGPYEGYKVLVDAVLKFFDTGVLPFDRQETVEIFAFMKAANMSLERGGKSVTIEEAMKEGRKEAKKLLKKY